MRPPRLRPLIGAVPVTALVAVVAAGLLPAHAASLGGLNVASLTAFSQPVALEPPPPPGPLVEDDFSGCQGSIGGAGSGWITRGSDFQCQGAWARSQGKAPWASAVLETGASSGIVVSTEISSVRDQRTGNGAGLALFAGGSSFLAVVYDRDRGAVEVVPVVDGEARMPLASRGVPVLDGLVLSSTIDGNVLSVAVNGETVIPGVDVPDVLSLNTRHGITADQDNQTRFEWFRVERLP